MIRECTNALQTALLLTIHFNSALLRAHNPVLRHTILPVELKLDDPITPGIFCAWRQHFNHQVRSACHALSSGDFRLPRPADKYHVRDDPAEITEDHARCGNQNTDRIADKIGSEGHQEVVDDALMGNAWGARH